MRYQVTIRYGTEWQRYHTFEVEADDVREALRRAADSVPEEVTPEADLVEIRIAPDPEDRSFLGE